MASILTNVGAISALQTLRSISSQLGVTQNQVSSGLRIGQASDNAAYWSIATTMRSDRGSLSAVQDAIGLGAAKVDTAYAGITAVVEILSDVKAKLVAATEDGVDKSKIQEEVSQLKQQIVDVSKSASFSGQNWLRADTQGRSDAGVASVASSFVRSGTSVSVQHINVDLSKVALFSSSGVHGLLEAQIGPGQIGGMRGFEAEDKGRAREFIFVFDGPIEFVDNTTTITFDIEVDGDDAFVPGRQPGVPHSITLDRSAVDAYDSSLNGQISSAMQMVALLESVLQPVGAFSKSYSGDRIIVSTSESSGLRGANFVLNNVQSTLAASSNAGMASGAYGDAAADYYDYIWAYQEKENFFTGPFQIDETVTVSFDVDVKGNSFTAEIDHALVNDTLGVLNGRVSNVGELRRVMQAAIDAQGGGVEVSRLNSDDDIMLFALDRSIYPDSGSDSYLRVGNFRDNTVKSNQIGIADIDVTNGSYSISFLLENVEAMLSSTTSAAALLGALQSRIGMQSDFVSKLTDSLDRGVGRLVDADMNEASAKLKALQTQQQLAVQSLSIANSNSENIISLFR